MGKGHFEYPIILFLGKNGGIVFFSYAVKSQYFLHRKDGF